MKQFLKFMSVSLLLQFRCVYIPSKTCKKTPVRWFLLKQDLLNGNYKNFVFKEEFFYCFIYFQFPYSFLKAITNNAMTSAPVC